MYMDIFFPRWLECFLFCGSCLYIYTKDNQSFKNRSQCLTVSGTCLMYMKDWSSMLQNMTFHISLTCRSLSLILPARDLIYVNPSLVRDALWPIAPTQSRALTLVPSSLYLRGLYYTVQRAKGKQFCPCIQNLLCHIWHKILIIM